MANGSVLRQTQVITLSRSDVVIGAGEYFAIEIPAANIPSGYTVIGIMGWNIGARHQFNVTGVQYYSNEVHIFGLSSESVARTVSPSASLLCVPD